jgi:hypothetical protein
MRLPTVGHSRSLEWHDNRLLGPNGIAIEIVQDSTYPTMWRVKYPDGKLSNMITLPRARDAARVALLRILNERPGEAAGGVK